MAQNYYPWTPSPVLPPCYGIFGHNGQLGSVVSSPEQVNYAHYNQGFRNDHFFQTPQNLFGQQMTPPGFENNQGVPQKSNLELLLENLVLDNFRHNKEFEIQARNLKDSLDRLSSTVDSFCTHNKTLEIQIPHVGHQVASHSQTSGILPSQPKANPKVQPNDVILRDDKQLEDPVVETKTNEVEVESEKPLSEKVVIESEKPDISPQYEPNIPFPHGFDESKLDEQFRKLIGIIQDKLPSRLKDPVSFSKPSVIGSEIIERAMCDLGENVSLMPLSLCERLGIR
ncbi:hypothetical protein MTR_4g012680 [Medicago truncatula]|uniref:Uncharacterized protein n=1 Tax=Medicago truncatula TaxID=3880 RepID=G7JJC3_MEDTR|nr:hypothetical protein MTR_4g012680 [Medicago truncatula]